MSQSKVFKKGETIFKEGDKISTILIVQSGGVSLCLQKNKKFVELSQLGPSSVLGESALSGIGTYQTSAVATTETKIFEIPMDAYKAQIETLPPPAKSLIKNLIDRLRSSMTEVKTARLEKDGSPCPEDQVAKAFGCIYHCLRHKGLKSEDSNVLLIDWNILKQYSQRIFGEMPRRTEQVANILVKLKLAEYIMGPPIDDPEGKPEIQSLKVFDLLPVESFFEFYQYYYFKSGKLDLLRVNEDAHAILREVMKLTKGVEADRFGVVSLDFEVVLNHFKDEMNIQIGGGHFSLLESKGLFAKRKALSDGRVQLQFELKEFQTQLEIWKFLREIEKWNEKGYVDLNEVDEVNKKKKSDHGACPSCNAEVNLQAKFCGECGFKMSAEDKKVA